MRSSSSRRHKRATPCGMVDSWQITPPWTGAIAYLQPSDRTQGAGRKLSWSPQIAVAAFPAPVPWQWSTSSMGNRLTGSPRASLWTGADTGVIGKIRTNSTNLCLTFSNVKTSPVCIVSHFSAEIMVSLEVY